MPQAQCLLRLPITCRLCRVGDHSTLLLCSSYNNNITNSNKLSSKLSSPSSDLDLHSTQRARWLCLLAGTSCPLGSSSHQRHKEALPGESPHPKPKWFNVHPPLQQFRLPATLRPLTHLAASRLGRYSVPWVRDNYSNSSRQEWVSLLPPSLKALRLALVVSQDRPDPLRPFHQLLVRRATSLPSPLVRLRLLFSRVHQGLLP